jgi:hypothetical protein
MFGPALQIVLRISIFFVVAIVAVVDAAIKPSSKFVAVGSSKALWIKLVTVYTLFVRRVGFFLALVYFLAIRPRVNHAMRS